MILQVGQTIRGKTHETGLLSLQLSLCANVTGHFARRPSVLIIVFVLWDLFHLFDDASQDDVHLWGSSQMLLAQGAYHIVVHKVAVQTVLAKGVATSCGDRIHKLIHADGAHEMLLQGKHLAGRWFS